MITAATLIDKQRDHFIHAVNVFLTGLSIYAENEAYRKAFDSAVPEKDYIYAYQTPHEEFFFRWGVAALFHDVGYPVEIVGHQINRFIRMVADADGDEVRIKAQIRFENFSELNHIREVVPKRPFTRAYYDAYESCSYIDLLTPNDLLAHHVHQTLGTDLMETKKAVDRFVDDMAASGFIDHGYYSAMIILKWYGYAIQMSGDHPERFYWPILDSATAILLHNYFEGAPLLEELRIDDLEGLRTLEGLEDHRYLKIVNINNALLLRDISPLEGCSSLGEFRLSGNGPLEYLTDVSVLGRLPRLCRMSYRAYAVALSFFSSEYRSSSVPPISNMTALIIGALLISFCFRKRLRSLG